MPPHALLLAVFPRAYPTDTKKEFSMRLASQRKYALILIDTCIYLAVYAATVLIAFQSSTI